MIVASLCPSLFPATEAACGHFQAASIQKFITDISYRVDKYLLFCLPGQDCPAPLRALPRVSVFCSAEMRECLREEPIDIWHDFGFCDAGTLAGLRDALGLVYSITAERPLRVGSQTREESLRGWSDSDALVYPTPALQERFSPSGGIAESVETRPRAATPQCHLIRPALDSRFLSGAAKADARRLLGFKETECVLLCYDSLGGFARSHATTVVNAFRRLLGAHPDARLVISGPDPQGWAAQLKRNLGRDSSLAGITILPNPESHALPLLFGAADIFVQASSVPSVEGLLAAVCAAVHQLAVIGARHSPAEGVVEHLRTGMLVSDYSMAKAVEYLRPTRQLALGEGSPTPRLDYEYLDEEELHHHLRGLMDNAELRRTLGQAASRRAAEDFSPEQNENSYLQLWSLLIEKRAAGVNSGTSGARPPGNTPQRAFPAPALDENRRLRLTPAGRTALDTQHLALPQDLVNVIYPAIVLEILNSVKSERTIGEVMSGVERDLGSELDMYERSGLYYHLLWALQHGLVILAQ